MENSVVISQFSKLIGSDAEGIYSEYDYIAL